MNFARNFQALLVFFQTRLESLKNTNCELIKSAEKILKLTKYLTKLSEETSKCPRVTDFKADFQMSPKVLLPRRSHSHSPSSYATEHFEPMKISLSCCKAERRKTKRLEGHRAIQNLIACCQTNYLPSLRSLPR